MNFMYVDEESSWIILAVNVYRLGQNGNLKEYIHWAQSSIR